jgi:transglutaminase/protease-like cytokinesis protein 3
VLIGDVAEKGGGGACRHRALLFKLMADEAGLHTALVRGNARFGERGGGHAWNEVRLADGRSLLVDVMNPHFMGRGYFDFPELSDALVKQQYLDMQFQPIYGRGAR